MPSLFITFRTWGPVKSTPILHPPRALSQANDTADCPELVQPGRSSIDVLETQVKVKSKPLNGNPDHHQIVFTHSDFSPQNIYGNPWLGICWLVSRTLGVCSSTSTIEADAGLARVSGTYTPSSIREGIHRNVNSSSPDAALVLMSTW